VRRPAAAAAVLAVLGTLVPVSQAVAASAGLAPRGGAVEVVGADVTYDFECYDMGGSIQPSWYLYGPSGTGGTIDDYQSGDGTTSGTFSVSYVGRTTGEYTLWVQCGWPGSEVFRSFTLESGKDATTTTLATSADTVVLGDTVTLTATVTGTTTSDVTFSADGTPFATEPVVNGTATTTRVVDHAQTFTASVAETGTALGSVSGAKTVDVVSAITAPQGVGISTYAAVGTPQSASVGEWAPSDVALSYSWKVDGVEVGTAATYTPVPADQGKQLAVTVTGTRAPLTAVSRTSPASTVALGTIQSGDLELDGLDDRTVVLGQTITPRPVGFGSDASFSYRWIIGDDERSVVSPTYTPTGADLGKTIRVEATITAPGKNPTDAWAWAWPGVATPTVTVGSSTITVGRDAVVPVTVAGPQDAPVPTGSVVVTATPRAGGDPVVLEPVVLDGSGAASVTLSGLSVGTWDTSVSYIPEPGQSHHYAVASIDFSTNPYTEASGAGTVTVTKVTPTVKLADTVTVPVATSAVFDVKVGGVRLPTTYVFREGSTVIGQGQLATNGTIGAVLPVLTPGSHTITLDVAGTAESFAASRSFTVVVGGEPVRSGALPTAQLETPKAATAPGQQMQLVAEGFEPGETVAFYLHSDPVFLGTAVAGPDGVARLLADIPADVPTGAHTVIATGGTSGRWATLAVELAVPAATPVAAADDLAVTGSRSDSLMVGASLMLLVGGGLVLVARRVRATR
jgi:hypothetical protein